MVGVNKFAKEVEQLGKALHSAKKILITAPGAADGDSIGAQLALRRMIRQRYQHAEVFIVNDEMLPPRYLFLPDAEVVFTPESFKEGGFQPQFDLAVIVDGGIDRAGRVKAWFDETKTRVFIDHHAVSCEYPYTIRLVEPSACATTELVYHLAQTPVFETKLDASFAQQVYLGLVFDTGYFRHSNTTADAMVLAASLLKTGFDFTRVGERGMLERSLGGLKLMAETLTRAQTRMGGRIIWSTLTQEMLKRYHAIADDREGIIDHLFLTHGIEVACLLFELSPGEVKVSLRSQGKLDVASFARELTVRGGGHTKAAGALLEMSLDAASEFVLGRLETAIKRL